MLENSFYAVSVTLEFGPTRKKGTDFKPVYESQSLAYKSLFPGAHCLSFENLKTPPALQQVNISVHL